MNIINKIEVKLEKFDKCFLLTDTDCPVGEIYNYGCALISFCIQKMQDNQPKQIEKIDPKLEESKD